MAASIVQSSKIPFNSPSREELDPEQSSGGCIQSRLRRMYLCDLKTPLIDYGFVVYGSATLASEIAEICEDATLVKMLEEEEFHDARSEEEEWVLARRGITLVLNNQYDEAQKLFTDRKDSIQLAAGHCFIVFMVNL
ncbi:Tetratricopeptide repeat protein 39C [Homalodisca vitripennis]|nr:Tetratricopeptide repeat protein 39C [Homalodisca vitripennis]